MEGMFASPVPFDGNRLRSVAATSLERFGEFGLRSNLIWQRLGDQLYDYELSFGLFNNQAQFRLGAERFLVNIQNARGKRDAELLVDLLARANKCVDATLISKTVFQFASHASFENDDEANSFFRQFEDVASDIVGGGRITVIRFKESPGPVRLAVERSITLKQGVFAVWSSERDGGATLEVLQQLADTYSKAAQKIGLEFILE